MELAVDKNYVFLCGYFSYDHANMRSNDFELAYKPWTKRLGEKGADDFYRFLGSYYYPTFLNASFPSVTNKNAVCNHFTLDNCASSNVEIHDTGTRCCSFNINYTDIWLLSQNTGIFAIKTTLRNGDAPISVVDISNYLYLLRSEASIIRCDGKDMGTVFEYINKKVLLCNDGAIAWKLAPSGKTPSSQGVSCNNKLKTFCAIETSLDVATEDGKRKEQELLFELGTGSRIGTIAENGDFAPSQSYYQKISENNSISIFNNWSALSLFDTFTVLINKHQNGNFTTFNNFENVYFPIYIHVIFLKFVLYSLNTEIAKLRISDKRNKILRDAFITIKNNYFLSHISYNFMPNEVYQHLIESLDIKLEIERMEERIEKINDYVEEQSSQAMNWFLGFMALVTPLSALWDVSEWGDKLFGFSSHYALFSSLIFAVLFIVPLSVIGILALKSRLSKTR